MDCFQFEIMIHDALMRPKIILKFVEISLFFVCLSPRGCVFRTHFWTFFPWKQIRDLHENVQECVRTPHIRTVADTRKWGWFTFNKIGNSICPQPHTCPTCGKVSNKILFFFRFYGNFRLLYFRHKNDFLRIVFFLYQRCVSSMWSCSSLFRSFEFMVFFY